MPRPRTQSDGQLKWHNERKTIRIRNKTHEKLKALKLYPGQSLGDVMDMLIVEHEVESKYFNSLNSLEQADYLRLRHANPMIRQDRIYMMERGKEGKKI